MALAHLVVLVTHDGRAVNVLGNIPAEALVQQIVLGRGGEVLRASHDVGDAHEVIVHDVCKVIGRQPVTLYKHLIVERFVLDAYLAEYLVTENGDAVLRDPLTDDIGLSLRHRFCGLLRRKTAAGVDLLFKSLALVLALFAEAAVGVTLFDEQLGVFSVQPTAFGLNIRTYGSADVGTLVVVKTAVLQGAVYHVDCALDKAALIGVLDAENELSSVVTCDKPGVKCGSEIADVHISRGTGRKAGAHLALGDASLHLVIPVKLHGVFLRDS